MAVSNVYEAFFFSCDGKDSRFRMAGVAARYVTLDLRGNCIVRERPKFDRENRLVCHFSSCDCLPASLV
jgi:hypothetical protein